MTTDDEDFPGAYLLYAVAVIVAIAVIAVSTFFIIVR